MEIRYVALADTANVSREGKLNITGIFTKIFAQGFPAAHFGQTMVVIVEGDPSDLGPHQLRVSMVDADGAQILDVTLEFEVNPEDPDRASTNNLLLNIQQLRFPTPGDYSFNLFIDGRFQYSIDIEAVQVTDGTDSAP